MRVETITSEAGLAGLQQEWDGLVGRSDWLAAQTFAYALAGWRSAGPGATLSIIVARRDSRLVGVWPLMCRKQHGAVVASHPGCGNNEEYAGALIESGDAEDEIAEALLREAKRRTDVILAWGLKPNSPLSRALRRDRGLKRRTQLPSHVVGLREFETWENWLKSKSKNFRQNLGGQRRGLAKVGALQAVEDDPAIIPYFFATKRLWLAEQGKSSPWVDGPQGERFFADLAKAGGPLKTFGLKLDGELIAAGICLISKGVLEYCVTTYTNSPTTAKFSPGMLVSEDCGRWAVEHQLDLDFRLMDVPYKERWRSRLDFYESFALAVNVRGAPMVLDMIVQHVVRVIRIRLAATVKGWLRREPKPAPSVAVSSG